MTVIIQELEIAVDVPSNNNSQGGSSSPGDTSLKEDIIKECIEKIMEIINLKNER